MLVARLALAFAAYAAAPATFAATVGPDQPAVTPTAAAGSSWPRARISRGALRDELAGALADDGSDGAAWVFDIEAAGDGVPVQRRRLTGDDPGVQPEAVRDGGAARRAGADGAARDPRVCARPARGRGDSVVGGDLVLVGDGDPSFGTGRFARANDQPATRVSQLARNVADAGVKRVAGRILADDSIFDRERRAGPDLSPLSGSRSTTATTAGATPRRPSRGRGPEERPAQAWRTGRRTGRPGRPPCGDVESKPLASIASPTVAKLIEETNVPSNNFFAEMLLKRLAATSGRKGTRPRQQQDRDVRGVGRHERSVDRRIGPLA